MKCCICLKFIKKDKKIFKCDECNNCTHFSCYFYWVKEKGSPICPYCKYKYPNNIIDYKINDKDLSEDELTTTSSDESTENNQEYRILINAQDNQNIYRPYYNYTCKILNYCIFTFCFLSFLLFTLFEFNKIEYRYNNTLN